MKTNSVATPPTRHERMIARVLGVAALAVLLLMLYATVTM